MNYIPETNRICATDENGKVIAEITFPVRDGIATIEHTYVDDSLRGQGIAGQLVQMAVEKIHANGNQIAATCPYAAAWLQRHHVIVELFNLQDRQYAGFLAKLLPTVPRETIIGVRTPTLRKMAKQVTKTPAAREFLQTLPHRYFDENQLHAFIISEEKDFDTCIALLNRFLPYIDNWATCDQLSPQCFKKHTAELLTHIQTWMAAQHTYTIRFGMGMLMQYYLDDAFRPEYLEWVAAIHSEEYYIRMMQAWFFATALAKQWDAAFPYIEQHRLLPFTHNKAIQKGIESYRITKEQKDHLRTLRI